MIALEELKDKPGIYCIENLSTHKKYVGQATSISERFEKHIRSLNAQTHFNSYLQHAWNKYGEDDFTYSVLEYCNSEELDDREIYYINTLDLLNRDFGYNRKTGGQHGGSKYSEEARKKMSDSAKASYTDELRQKRSEQLKEMWSNPEEREKRVGKNHPMYGRIRTDEVKKKLSECHKGHGWNRKFNDKVLCIETNQIFDNSRDANQKTGIDSSCILKVCRGERKIAGGYHWQFIKVENLENKVS